MTRPARLTWLLAGLTIVAAAGAGQAHDAPTVQVARYEVTFEATWSDGTHPTDFPSSAHFSGLIGGTHDSTVEFWRAGDFASEGIRLMAERGSKFPLSQEVERAIGAGSANTVLSGGNLGRSPGAVNLQFDISQRFSLVTLVTMVAPSPDWFVGVSGLALFENGQWVEERRVSLDPYDAGTDSGITYGSPDLPTVPRAPIARITGYPMAAAGRVAPFGTFTFRRIDRPSDARMAIDTPGSGAQSGQSFRIAGWAVDLAATTGAGVDTVHVYAYPYAGGSFGAPIFLGASDILGVRDDVGSAYGSQFRNAAFTVQATLPPGVYRLVASARSTVTRTFNNSLAVDVTINPGNPVMSLDGPESGSTVSQPFRGGGWAVDLDAPTGTGVDAIHVWAFPLNGGPAIFVDAAAIGVWRPDVGSVFGAEFTHAGYHFLVTGLAPGVYDLGVYAHSTVSGTFSQQRIARIQIGPD